MSAFRLFLTHNLVLPSYTEWRNSLMQMFLENISPEGMPMLSDVHKNNDYSHGWANILCRGPSICPPSLRSVIIICVITHNNWKPCHFQFGWRSSIFHGTESLVDSILIISRRILKSLRCLESSYWTRLPLELRAMHSINTKIALDTMRYDNLPESVQKIHVPGKTIGCIRPLNRKESVKGRNVLQGYRKAKFTAGNARRV
mmetsp:Transcript_33926/g.53086  ORF Transcript_33926/g.53086 Transcript_33926/m.53086 type:complete len:201 (+) Transcript_33926:29-631(+)